LWRGHPNANEHLDGAYEKVSQEKKVALWQKIFFCLWPPYYAAYKHAQLLNLIFKISTGLALSVFLKAPI
jgi:hypothetical protein